MSTKTPESMVQEPPASKAKLTHQTLDKKSATQGFGWQFGFNLINKFVLPIASILIARMLGPKEMGAFAVVFSIFNAAEVLRDAGLTQTYIRDNNVEGKREGAYMALGTLQGVIPAILLFLFRDQLAAFFTAPKLVWSMPWVAAALVVNGIGTIPRAKVLRMGRLYESGIRELVANILALGTALVLVFMGFGYTALLVQLCLNCVLNVVITYAIAPIATFSFSAESLWDTFRSSVSTMGANVLLTIYTQADNFTVAHVLSKVDTGFYTTGWNLASKPMQLVSGPMMRTMQVAFGQNSHDLKKLASLFCRAVAVSLLFVAPVYVVMAVAADPLVHFLLGEKWYGTGPVVQILFLYMGARTIGTTGGTALVAAGKARVTLISWFGGYAVAVGILASMWGHLTVERVAWAFAGGALTVYTLHMILAFNYFKPSQSDYAKVRKALIPMVLTGLVIAVVQFVPLPANGQFVLPFLGHKLRLEPRILLTVFGAPLFHLAAMGLLYERKPGAYMSKSGIKRLYKSL